MSRSSLAPKRTVTPDFVTVSEVAVLLGRSQSTIRAWIRDGRLPARRDFGGGVLVPLDALRAMPPVAQED